MIKLDKVSFSYKGTDENGLKEVSLHIKKGECVLLCGPSGCGKTTLTRLINGLIPDFFEGELSGKIEVNGINTLEADISKISDIAGTVFQNPRTQFFNTDTDSEIVFGLENKGYSVEKMMNRLEEVTNDLQIQELRNRNIFELSGGEKQKIAFASVYATNPEIFVLDEPSSNLDYRSIGELKEFIKKIKAQDKTIVIAEHRIWYLTDIVDRVILMKEGRLIKDLNCLEFNNFSAEEIKFSGLRSRDLSEIKAENMDVSKGEHIFEAKELSVKLGKKMVLDNISFKAYGGEIVAITGENGAGKTTLARALCGLTKAEKGKILLDGDILTEKKRKEKSYMVMQDVGHQLFTDSVEAECRLGMDETKAESIDETLVLFSLSEFKDRHPLSLSGGQKQRLAVAVSLLCGKEILIFDEPTSGLDLSSMEKVGSLMKMLAEEEKIVLVITHDIEFIKTICNRVLIMSKGEIVKELSGTDKSEIEKYLG